MDIFRKYINSFTRISEKSCEALWSKTEMVNYASKEIICQIESNPIYVYYLKEGYVRGFVVSKKGKEFNREIYTPIEFFASLTSLTERKDSRLGLQALTDCVVYRIAYKEYMNLAMEYPDLLQLYRRTLEISFSKLEDRVIELSTLTATERYLALRKRIKNVDNKISQFQIASHLGITPIQLSRIRRELFSK